MLSNAQSYLGSHITLCPVYNHNNKIQKFWDGGKKLTPKLNFFFWKWKMELLSFATKEQPAETEFIFCRETWTNIFYSFIHKINVLCFDFFKITMVKTGERGYLIRPEHNIIRYPTINNKCKKKQKMIYIIRLK